MINSFILLGIWLRYVLVLEILPLFRTTKLKLHPVSDLKYDVMTFSWFLLFSLSQYFFALNQEDTGTLTHCTYRDIMKGITPRISAHKHRVATRVIFPRCNKE